MTGLSCLPRPKGWVGPWIELDRDDRGAVDVTARGQLHWAPRGDAGLRNRMAAVSTWINECAPTLMVSDVSVEITLLARLHGIPVVTVVLPGDRGDPTHVLGYRLSDRLVAMWPSTAREMVTGLPKDVAERIQTMGGLSRFAVAEPAPRRDGGARVTVLTGTGGCSLTEADLASARRQTPEWSWTVLAPSPLGCWSNDPRSALVDADVVVTHAGQNAIAEVAAARRPAVVMPEARPHDEQTSTARALEGHAWPVTVRTSWAGGGWADTLGEASQHDGRSWAQWCDGEAAQRFVGVLQEAQGSLAPTVSAP